MAQRAVQLPVRLRYSRPELSECTRHVQTTDGGVSSVSLAYTVEVRAPDGTLTSSGYEALFIPEGAAWKVWLTGPRP